MYQPMDVLGAMITPTVLISSAALILLSTVSRLGRVNDRLQFLVSDADQLASSLEADATIARKRETCSLQLENLQERLLLLRSAVTSLYVTIALLIMTSILIGLYVQFPRLTTLLPISVGMFGALAFLYSILLLILEALHATRVTMQEIRLVRDSLDVRRTEA